MRNAIEWNCTNSELKTYWCYRHWSRLWEYDSMQMCETGRVTISFFTINWYTNARQNSAAASFGSPEGIFHRCCRQSLLPFYSYRINDGFWRITCYSTPCNRIIFDCSWKIVCHAYPNRQTGAGIAPYTWKHEWILSELFQPCFNRRLLQWSS